MKQSNATIYKIDLNAATVQDVCLQFEHRNVVFIQWATDYLIICVEDY